jgi:SAM-dependent methyltransferase
MTERPVHDRPAGHETMAAEMPHATNYYGWIASQLRPYLGVRILDIGGGYGAHLESLLAEGYRVLSIDMSEDSVQFMRNRFKYFPDFQADCADFGRVDVQETLTQSGFDTITCLNVLEHIEDDRAALKDMHSILAPQRGTLLLQVPALEWLFGSLDQQAGHFRRYTRRTVSGLLTEAGFKIIQVRYFNLFGVLPWLVNARILKRSVTSGAVDAQIRIFDRYLVPPLRVFEQGINPPLGQSLIAVASAAGGG